MALPQQNLQICPTRIDGSPVLVAHKVDRASCQTRQRKRYHKCFTCAWNNNYVAIHGEPSLTPEVVSVADEEEVAAPEPEPATARVG